MERHRPNTHFPQLFSPVYHFLLDILVPNVLLCRVYVAFHARHPHQPRPWKSSFTSSTSSTSSTPFPLTPLVAADPKTKDLKSASPSSPRRSIEKTHTLFSFPRFFELSPLAATHTKNAPVSPLLATHTKTKDLKSFSCHTYEKTPGGGTRFPAFVRSFFRLCLYLVTSLLHSSGANHASSAYHAVRINLVVP